MPSVPVRRERRDETNEHAQQRGGILKSPHVLFIVSQLATGQLICILCLTVIPLSSTTFSFSTATTHPYSRPISLRPLDTN